MKIIKNSLIAFAVAFGVAVILSLLQTLTGADLGSSSFTLAMALGIMMFFFLQMKSGNRKETRADDAAREAALPDDDFPPPRPDARWPCN